MEARIPVLFSDVDGDEAAPHSPARSHLPIRSVRDAVATGRGRAYTSARPTPADTAMLL
jgi:hypothetical protein